MRQFLTIRRGIAVLCAGLVVAATAVVVADQTGSTTAAAATTVVPRPDHTVVVMLENKNATSVIGSASAPYINALATRGALMTQSYGVAHPSQPNYLALFSGSTQGVTSNDCPHNFATADNLGRQLVRAGLSFTGYAESLPSVGYTGCISGQYQRKHNSWVDFGTVPAAANQPFSAFPTDYSTLPTVAFVTPNMCHDMHDCSVATGDAWLKANLDGYARWAVTHHSLLVVTFDENEGGTVNQIPTILVGATVRPGSYAERLNHYNLLRTIEDAYGLPALGAAAAAAPLTTIWTSSPPVVNGLVNGTFESGLAGWSVSGTARLSAGKRHGGTYAAVADFTPGRVGDTILAQTFTAKASTLTVWYAGECAENPKNAWLSVVVKRNTSGKVSTVVPATCQHSGYHKATLALTVGHSYTVQLINHDDGKPNSPNRSYFDDITVS